MTLTLKDGKGGLVSVLVNEGFNMKNLPVHTASSTDKANSSTFTVGRIAPVTSPGEYEVFVSVGMRDGTPKIALPLAGDDGQRRYKLGKITLTAQ